MTARNFSGVLAVLAVFMCSPASAVAGQSNAASTQAYLQANYTVVHAFVSRIPTAEAEVKGILAGVRRECSSAANESPQDVDSEQLSNELIGVMVTTVTQHFLAPARTAIRATEHLSWSSGALTRAVRSFDAKAKVQTSLAVPHVCADVKAWVASHYLTLPASTVSFDARFWPNWISVGALPAGLAQYETPADKALARKTANLEERIAEFEADVPVEAWGAMMDSMGLNP
jgi:hypothetical protein